MKPCSSVYIAEEHRSGGRASSLLYEIKEEENTGDRSQVSCQRFVHRPSRYCLYQYKSVLPEKYTFVRRRKSYWI